MKNKKVKKVLIVLLAILIFLGLIYLGVSIFVDTMLGKTTVEEIEPEEIEIVVDETPKAHEVVNFMVVGADNLDADRVNSYTEERSDVFKIVSLDYTDNCIKILSLDRDVVVWIPDKGETGEFGHFNWAYSFGGGKYAINTINYNLDLDVSKFVAFSFKGFRDVIDTIGGIDVRLNADEAKVLNKDGHVSMTCIEGDNHLDGLTALNYASIRHLDSDFVRMDRQNVVINAVIKKFKDSSFMELFDVVDSCLPYITTNLTSAQIKRYVLDLVKFNLGDIRTQTYPLKKDEDVCWNKDSLGGYLVRSYSNQVIDVHTFIYGTDDYKPSKTIYDNEKKTYDTFGEFYENSELMP